MQHYKDLPSLDYLFQRLDFDPMTGVFLWRNRPAGHFPNAALCGTWNTRYAGKIAGTKHAGGYHAITIDDARFLAHRLAWVMTYGEIVPQDIDHIDCNKTNNRIANLRAATRPENTANARKSKANSSGFKGVSFDTSRGRFEAYIGHLNKHYHLGRFDTLEEAITARNEAADRLKGEFVRYG